MPEGPLVRIIYGEVGGAGKAEPLIEPLSMVFNVICTKIYTEWLSVTAKL